MHVFIHNHPNTGATFYDLLLFPFIQVWRDLSQDSIFFCISLFEWLEQMWI